MTIEREYSRTLQDLESDQNKRIVSAEEIITLLDLTLLDTEANEQALSKFVQKTTRYPVAAACVYPRHLLHLPQNLSLKRATVVNFPEGLQPLTAVEEDARLAIDEGKADELDYVFPYTDYLKGKTAHALNHCQTLYELCRSRQVVFKVILETGAFPSVTTLYRACREIIEQGCDFLKTSTGKIAIGATPLAVFTLMKAIHDSNSVCGIKVSGGVKQKSPALAYIHLAEYCLDKPVHKSWFRIGASSLLDELTQSP
ncbi:deoxyribose-phosphate aldolase [Legionella taurinensis]|uniref:deoxyribose-phosphate aldolase n=1 Tax=Legionella taurinensis TaxID=70611 RepID=A0A3A5L7B7_9GAMM|nr:deoxyribose-phosphate aldolase [Legionella taurinensis]RJT45558.1 deoxyribose-phosphate aldolase [Legionella taurinensis]RJT66174.1 deoxyribose-phosphate aldolase [Legionella taurinensis]STY26302.1 2-deoxyribose-5-phosphate aldolase [Legionella taurinensis]